MENMNQRIAIAQLAGNAGWIAAPQSERALMLACATPAVDSRTTGVRIDVRVATTTAAPAIQGKRVRVTATTGMGHVGFAAAYVPGSLAWSPPI